MQYLTGSAENIRLAMANLFANRLRAFLTTIGITIGVSAVVVLLSVGRAFEDFVVGQFSSIGTNLIAVTGEQGERGEFEPLTQDDLDALSDPLRVPDSLWTVAILDVSGREVSFGDRNTTPTTFGVTPEYILAEQREVVAGRYIDEKDQEGAARVAVIGSSTVENLFPPGVYPIGQTIRLGDIPFRVVGVMSEQGSGGFVDLDDTVFVPMRTAQNRLSSQRDTGGSDIVTRIILKARDEDSVDAVVEQITTVLREEHDIAFNGEDDFAISTQEDLLARLSDILRLLTYFLAAIAGISLLVGGIGIMNIMLVTVTERTKEIGLRKAVGAQNYDIMLQFITEAVTLSLIGGAMGIGVAAAGGAIVTAVVPTLDVRVDPLSVILAVGISTLIGVFFGIFPAQRAANLNPIDALRYE